MEVRLRRQRYLLGAHITEADWRFFTTLVRFDPVYVGHFKCNLRRIVDYPALSGYLRDLYQMPGIAKTVVMDHIKKHYYQSQLHNALFVRIVSYFINKYYQTRLGFSHTPRFNYFFTK